ncbi:MAG: hypothetical protein A2991_00760 [Candidatus Terrybacteria bacterium RIFCSPLOWO2_01_FULL_58_14]|uniref:Uncharacterized protein n=1 Tax=Candidatus Terrybacteria bacterium RIFCSPLOWO2_01_FULL_58_14 TaxID=1802369 RepID=A0A1G2PY12_9BACT|nr:MAG: hypothetical protein A2991_00760 [Candidatus Terrybacteria bacterium RIFCSPLOWO2_01_FULL_58_14]
MKARTLVFLGVVGVAMALFVLACSGGKTDRAPVNPSPTIEATVVLTDEPASTATSEPTATAVPSPTAEVVAPPSANPVPGSCLILEQQYCGLGERVSWQAPWGSTLDLLGFRLPAGAVIFSPRDGSVSGDTGGSSALHPNASVVGVYQPDSYDAFQATGDLALNIRGLSTVTAGVPLAQLQDTGIRLVGDYNLIVEFLAADDQQRIVTDEGTIAQLFP